MMGLLYKFKKQPYSSNFQNTDKIDLLLVSWKYYE
jgi:hypothetical protein